VSCAPSRQSYTLLRASQEWAAPSLSEDDYRQTVRVTMSAALATRTWSRSISPGS
jgi:hypothetical protein